MAAQHGHYQELLCPLLPGVRAGEGAGGVGEVQRKNPAVPSKTPAHQLQDQDGQHREGPDTPRGRPEKAAGTMASVSRAPPPLQGILDLRASSPGRRA